MAKSSENRRNVAQAFISAAKESTERSKRNNENQAPEPEKRPAITQRKAPEDIKSERVTIRLTKTEKEAIENLTKKRTQEVEKITGFSAKIPLSNVIEEIVKKYLDESNA